MAGCSCLSLQYQQWYCWQSLQRWHQQHLLWCILHQQHLYQQHTQQWLARLQRYGCSKTWTPKLRRAHLAPVRGTLPAQPAERCVPKPSLFQCDNLQVSLCTQFRHLLLAV